MNLPPSWINLQKQNGQNIILILGIRQIRSVVSGRRAAKWSHWFPELITWGSVQAAGEKGGPRAAQGFSHWADRVGSLSKAIGVGEEEKQRAEKCTKGEFWRSRGVPLEHSSECLSVPVMGGFSKSGERTTGY